jgi:hypothetical protein
MAGALAKNDTCSQLESAKSSDFELEFQTELEQSIDALNIVRAGAN